MAIVRPVSAFISVSLTASGAWSEMNGISPLMPMIARQGVATRRADSDFADDRSLGEETSGHRPSPDNDSRCAHQHRGAQQRLRGGVARLQLAHRLEVRPRLRRVGRVAARDTRRRAAEERLDVGRLRLERHPRAMRRLLPPLERKARLRGK